jgi:hypothetical protein
MRPGPLSGTYLESCEGHPHTQVQLLACINCECLVLVGSTQVGLSEFRQTAVAMALAKAEVLLNSSPLHIRDA